LEREKKKREQASIQFPITLLTVGGNICRSGRKKTVPGWLLVNVIETGGGGKKKTGQQKRTSMN